MVCLKAEFASCNPRCNKEQYVYQHESSFLLCTDPVEFEELEVVVVIVGFSVLAVQVGQAKGLVSVILGVVQHLLPA